MTNVPVKARLPIKARIDLTAPQYSQIAATYEHAAADWTLPPQPRAAFAKKATWFRLRAQIRVAKQAMALLQNAFPLMEPRPFVGTGTHPSLPELGLAAKYVGSLAMSFPLMEPQPYRPLVGTGIWKATPSPTPRRREALNVLNHAA